MTSNQINNYDDYANSIAQSNIDGTNRAHMYIEKPAMYSALPDVKAMRILCIGCGTGEECGYLSQCGAEVTGIDISVRSIKIAKNRFAKVAFNVMDMHKLSFPDDAFDLVYSSLTLHYSENLESVLQEISRVLRPTGTLIFSALHPIKWGSEAKRDTTNERRKSFMLGYDSFTSPSRIFGDYLNVNSIIQKPEGCPVIQYWNRPISEYFRVIKLAGFKISEFIEPKPVSVLKEVDEDYWDVQSRIPQFMIFALEKQAS